MAAWATSLGWERKVTRGVRNSPRVLVLPICATCLCFASLQKLDYYEHPLEKHIAWLGFQSAVGVSLASTVYVLTRPLSPIRHIFTDLFCLLGYNFGYCLLPVIIADQLKDGKLISGSNVEQSRRTDEFNSLLIQCTLIGYSGVFYGMTILKLTGLGFFRANQRTISQKLLMFAALTIGSTVASMKLFEKSAANNVQN